jgi:hypothetical protein
MHMSASIAPHASEDSSDAAVWEEGEWRQPPMLKWRVDLPGSEAHGCYWRKRRGYKTEVVVIWIGGDEHQHWQQGLRACVIQNFRES